MSAIFPAFLAAVYGGARFAVAIKQSASEGGSADVSIVVEMPAFWKRELAD